jgi:hypothetical protein
VQSADRLVERRGVCRNLREYGAGAQRPGDGGSDLGLEPEAIIGPEDNVSELRGRRRKGDLPAGRK